MSFPILTIIPSIGWDTGVNVKLVDVNITEVEAIKSLRLNRSYGGRKFFVDSNTLIIKVRALVIEKNHYYVGFLSEEGLFALFPQWIFGEKKES